MSIENDFRIENHVLTKYCGAGGAIVVPDNVTSIGEEAFYECSELTSVTIPNSVTTIDYCAFLGCTKLTNVIIPDSVTTIGRYAFCDCSSLTSVTIPAGVTDIGNDTFRDCTKLKSVTIPDSVTIIGERAFSRCSSLTSITIPDSVMSIGAAAFYGCTGLTSITIPDRVTSIDGYVFNELHSLTELIIPKNVSSLGIIYDCANLKKICMPKSAILTGDEYDWCNGDFLGDCPALESIEFVDEEMVYYIKKNPDGTPLLEIHAQNGFGLSRVLGMMNPDFSIVINRKKDHNKITEKIVVCAYRDHTDDSKGINNLEALNIVSGESINYNKYDSFILNGAKKFKLKANDKLRAAYYRLRYPVELADSYRSEYEAICRKGIKKLLPIAIEELDAEGIVMLFKMGIVSEKDRPAALKLMAAASEDKIKLLVQTIDQIVPVCANVKPASTTTCQATSNEKITNLAKEYVEKVTKLNGNKKIMQMGLAASALPDVILRDSEEIAPKEILQYILVSYGSQYVNSKNYKLEFIEDADNAANLLNTVSLQKAMEEIYENVNAVEHLQILFPYCRLAGIKGINRLISDLNKWHSWSEYGQRGRNCEIIASAALMLSDTKEAMVFIDKKKQLGKYAEIRGTDEDSIRDLNLAEFGLNSDGKKAYNLGEKNIIVSLSSDLTFALFDEATQKSVKSIPKKGVDPELAQTASSDFAEMKKMAKKVAQRINKTLFDDFLSGRRRAATNWMSSYMQNPLLKQIAKLIVWNQGDSTFTLAEGGAIDCNGVEYMINTSVEIGVAHPMEMKESEVEQWQRYFTSRGLKQPFLQIWEPTIDPSAIKEDRYEGCLIPFYRFKNQEKHGIGVEDINFHDEIYINLKDCQAIIERTDYRGHDFNNEDTFEISSFKIEKYSRQANHIVAYLDKITVSGRILKDDISIESWLPQFTLAQITEFIDLASKNECFNVTALLLDYKNRAFVDYDPMDEFSLDL
jgi:hypothetical protein